VIALAAIAVAAGVGLALLTVRQLDAGRTWDDWQAVDTPGWFTVLQVVLVAMFVGGLIVAGPVELKVVLVGVPGGFCLVYFSIGLRRRFGKTTRPEPDPDPEPVERESLGSHLAWLGVSFAIGLAVGYIVDLRGFELVAVALGIALLTNFNDLLRERLSRWILGR
jgi:hypothetical protein